MLRSLPIPLILFLLGVSIGGGDSPCQKDQDCQVPSSVCVDSKCLCPPGFVLNSLKTKCLSVGSGFGSPCNDNLQCSESLDTGGECNNGSCVCTDGFHYLKGRCWKTSGLAESCISDENCFVVGDFQASVCTEKKVCTCAPNYYQREYSSCRKICTSPGEPCGISLDCQFPGGVCNKQRKCEVEGKNVGGTPWISHQEQVLEETTVNFETTSKKCGTDKDCGVHQVCGPQKECVCQQGFYLNQTICAPEIGSECSSETDCVGRYMTCDKENKLCICSPGFVAAQGNQFCKKLARDILWSCLSDEQCLNMGPRSKCVSKKCNCPKETSHFNQTEHYCWVSQGVGEECQAEEDCKGGLGEGESCVDKKCQCKANFHPDSKGRVCNPDSKEVGGACAEDNDCLFPFSKCDLQSGKCGCLPNYIPFNSQCASGVGGMCNSTIKCQIENSECGSSGKCVCKEGFVGSNDSSICLKVASKDSNICSEICQCHKYLGEGSNCTEKVCTCITKYHLVDGFGCQLDARINGNCTRSIQCPTNAKCSKGYCKCNSRYRPTYNMTACIHSGVNPIMKEPLLKQFLVLLPLIITANLFAPSH